MGIIKTIKKDVKKAVEYVKAVPAGVADYRAKDIAAHNTATAEVSAKQKSMISTAGQSGSPTPMGTSAFYGAVDQRASEIKKQNGVSLRSSIRSKLNI